MRNFYRIAHDGYMVADFLGSGAFLSGSSDLSLIQCYTWHLRKHGYPATHIVGTTVVLHRLLITGMGGYEIDHFSGDKLGNRRANLRVYTHPQNGFNQKRPHTNNSVYIDASFFRQIGCYKAYFHVHETKHHLGLSADPVAAAWVRDCAAKLLFGEFARLKLPRKAGR